MAKKFSELRAKMSQEAKAESDRLFQKELNAITSAKGMQEKRLEKTEKLVQTLDKALKS
jgi:hypothetical protein